MSERRLPDGRILVQLSDDDIAELVPEFLNNRWKDLAAIDEAVTANEFETVRRLGHSMKGVGSSFGFDSISTLGADIERAALAEDGGALRDCAAHLKSYLQLVEVAELPGSIA